MESTPNGVYFRAFMDEMDVLQMMDSAARMLVAHLTQQRGEPS